MKNYETPNAQFYKLENQDIITSSPGTETSIFDDIDGSWELSPSINS